MSDPHVTSLEGPASAAEAAEVLKQDGAVILRELVGGSEINAMMAELDPYLQRFFLGAVPETQRLARDVLVYLLPDHRIQTCVHRLDQFGWCQFHGRGNEFLEIVKLGSLQSIPILCVDRILDLLRHLRFKFRWFPRSSRRPKTSNRSTQMPISIRSN